MSEGMPGLLARAWASYREQVVPADAPPVQVQESQRAFYAGAAAIYYGIVGGLSEGPDPSPADEELWRSLDGELRAFTARVGRDA